MILGVGLDLVDISRFESTLSRSPELGTRVLAQSIGASRTTSDIARNFAILEALYKALPSDTKSTITDCFVAKGPDGRMEIEYRTERSSPAINLLFHVSITHERDMLIAIVVVENSQ